MTEAEASGGLLALGTPCDPARSLATPTSNDGLVVGSGRRGLTVRSARLSDGMAVAIKVGFERLGGDRARRRFVSDASPLTSLDACNLLRVLDVGTGPGGEPWMMTPWAEQGSLGDRLANGPVDVDEALRAGRDSATGLRALHDAGLVHANLSPANLVIVDAQGEVAVDGARVAHLEARLASLGVAAHVPPEVLEGGEWTAQGDLWAWGSVLYTVLQGRPPWAGVGSRGRSAFLLAMATGEAPGLRRSDMPDSLHRLIQAALSLEPKDRPDGAGALIAALTPSRSSRARTVAPGVGSGEGQALGSSYLLQRPLGTGTSGQVWFAERRWDHRAVAVKVLRAELAGDPEQVARFLRERTTLVGLTHPHLVPVLDLVAEGSTLAIVMDLVEGRDLRRVLAERPTLPPAELCWLLAQAASGVDAMHAAGIVHRDIKPENVLVEVAPDGSGVVRITDFGLARALQGPTLTRTDQLVGTVDYLAPELVAGRPLSPAADIYSLGVMAYEMLCGWRPFGAEADHPAAILQAQLQGIPPRPPAVPGALWDLVSRCLAKDPAARPDAAGLRAELLAVATTLGAAAALDPGAWR
ncbi:MAG: serine/threonine-protein kinase, partial [Actinomycetota bacterium]|nr:serine/threonine-protein kinase [Actinomycetota bacterium]